MVALGAGITYAMQEPAPYDTGSVRTLAIMDEFDTMDGSYRMQEALDESAGSTGTTNEGITADGEYYIEIDSYNSTQNARVNELKQQFKAEIRGLLDHEGTAEYGIESDRILASYDGFFRVVIEHVLVSTNAGVWSEPEILAAIDYIFHETVKDEKLKINAESYPSSQVQTTRFLEMMGMQMAHAACPVVTHPNYKQLRIDIDGGRYAGKIFNGGNDLYDVRYNINPATCVVTYTLYFHDEDHPTGDIQYDALRLVLYARIHDIESFTIQNNNLIKFDNTWSSNNKYDCIERRWPNIPFGCHATTTKSYIPGQTIYVSNTWNHMMDTSDTNRQLAKVRVP